MKYIFLIIVLGWSGFTQAKTVDKSSILSEYECEDTHFAPADAVLNKVRLTTVNIRTALDYAAEIEDMLAAYPDYPHRAEAYYFLGLNYKLTKEYKKAIVACKKALELKPELAEKTPLKSFIKGAIFESRALWYPRYAFVVIVVILLIGLGIRLKSSGQGAPVKHYLLCSCVITFVWLVLITVISFIDTSSAVTKVVDYPQPVLINTTIGTIGSAPLTAILLYGLSAVIAVLFFVYTTSGIKAFGTRKVINIAAALVLSTSAMVLCYMEYCYRNAEFIWEGRLLDSRMNILVKDLVWRNEIPDEMLKLYDEGFRNKVLESRKQK